MTLTENPALPVKIALDVVGHGSVEIDGHDIADRVCALSLDASVDGITTVTLQLNATAGAEFDGYARVQIAEPGGMAAAAEVVRSLDAQEVRQAAMASDAIRQGGGSADATFAAVLEVVAEALERSG